MAWDLEAGELALAVLCEVVLGDFMAWLGDHAGAGDRAQTRVGHADDLDLLDRWMGRQQQLDFGRVDILAADLQ